MDSTHGGEICDVSVSRCDLWVRNALQLMKNMISTFKQQLRATAVGGKKELGFPGYTSRSGLPFFNHVLPFPKRREYKWQKKIRHKRSGTGRANLHYARRTTGHAQLVECIHFRLSGHHLTSPTPTASYDPSLKISLRQWALCLRSPTSSLNTHTGKVLTCMPYQSIACWTSSGNVGFQIGCHTPEERYSISSQHLRKTTQNTDWDYTCELWLTNKTL